MLPPPNRSVAAKALDLHPTEKDMPWTLAHTSLLLMIPLSFLFFWYSRRWEDGSKSHYNVALHRFRFLILIGGIFGILILARFWSLYR